MSEAYQYNKWSVLTAEKERALSAFLNDCPGFHYFQSPQFFNVCRASKKLTPYYVVATENNEIVGILLFFRQIQIAIPAVSFLTSRIIIWGGPVARNNAGDVIAGLLRFYETHRPATIYTQVRNLVDTDAYKNAFLANGFQYDPHLTILVDMTRPDNERWQEVHTKRRNQIRRAEKEGCTVEQQNSIESLRACYSILNEVYHRAKLPLPDFSHFDSLLKQSTPDSGLRIFTVIWEAKIIGCMLCLAHGDWLFDYYAGAYGQYYKKYPNDLLPWAVFNWANTNGFRQFDFGGAGKPDVPYGVRDYKKQFGGTLVSFGRYEKIHYPTTFRLINKAYALWQRLR